MSRRCRASPSQQPRTWAVVTRVWGCLVDAQIVADSSARRARVMTRLVSSEFV